MKKITTKNGVIVLVSDVDYPELNKYNWYLAKDYARNGKLGIMHRVILKRVLGAEIPKGFITDHINRNKLDNRRENLRTATQSQNRINSASRIGQSGFRGVRKQKGRLRWRADITHLKKKIWIGSFTTIQEAAEAYNKKAKELYGEYAYLNKI